MSYETATQKFTIIVQDEVSKYLEILALIMEYETFNNLTIRLRKDKGINEIWPHIEKRVHERMMEEYGILYKTKDYPNGDINHPAYKTTQATLHEIDLREPSTRYQGTCLLHGSFWIRDKTTGVPKLSVNAPVVLLSNQYRHRSPGMN